MSIWTHVNGQIRIDYMDHILTSEEDVLELIKKLFGEIKTYDNDVYKTIAPCGCEGSLEFSFSNHILSIYGDLRCYGDKNKDYSYIYNWFNNLCKGLNRDEKCCTSIRQAFLQIESIQTRYYVWKEVYDKYKCFRLKSGLRRLDFKK